MALSVACRWSTMADRQLSCRLLQLSCQWCAAGIMAGAGVARLPSPSRPPPRPLFLLGTGHHPFTLHDGGARLHHGFYLTKDCSLGGTLHARHPSSPRHLDVCLCQPASAHGSDLRVPPGMGTPQGQSLAICIGTRWIVPHALCHVLGECRQPNAHGNCLQGPFLARGGNSRQKDSVPRL